MIAHAPSACCTMAEHMMVNRRWIDKWLCSDAEELLEKDGATPRGLAIMDELNRAYRRTGLSARLIDTIVSESRRIHAVTGNTVRILEIGMRDGSLLGGICEVVKREQLPLDIHGVEFRSDLAALAKERLAAQGLPVQIHYDASRNLNTFSSGDFDLVFSAFVLHHQAQCELKQLLFASFRISRNAVFHLDLTRSLWALALIWSFYTVFRYRASRKDAVLSCRRAYRPDEIAAIMDELNIGDDIELTREFPLYWSLRRPFEGGAT
jgi:SAM-dependent methyltransferase